MHYFGAPVIAARLRVVCVICWADYMDFFAACMVQVPLLQAEQAVLSLALQEAQLQLERASVEAAARRRQNVFMEVSWVV